MYVNISIYIISLVEWKIICSPVRCQLIFLSTLYTQVYYVINYNIRCQAKDEIRFLDAEELMNT